MTNKPKQWYRFEMAAKEDAELFLFGDIGGFWGDGVTAGQFAKDLKAAVDGKKSLTLRINSSGGSVFDGVAIANLIKAVDIPTTAVVEGEAASAASIIAIAAKKTVMRTMSWMMIHNPSGGVWGTAEDMRATADILDKLRAPMAVAYAAKSGKTVAEVEAAMDAETWFTAEDAKAWGLADSIEDGPSAEGVDAKATGPGHFAAWRQHMMAEVATLERYAAHSKGVEVPAFAGMTDKEKAHAETRSRGGETTMEIKDVAGLRAAHGAVVAQLESELRGQLEAVAKANQATAVSEALTAERARASAILDAVDGEAAAVVAEGRKQIAAGAELGAALVAVNKVRKEAAAEAKASKQGQLAARADADKRFGRMGSTPAADETDPGAEVPQPELGSEAQAKADWSRLVSEYQTKAKCSEGQAIVAMQKEHPQLHAMVFQLPSFAVPQKK